MKGLWNAFYLGMGALGGEAMARADLTQLLEYAGEEDSAS